MLLVLYGAGLRPGEGRRLRCCDVDLRERVLAVNDTKFFKSRLVPVGVALADALSAYAGKRRHLPMPAAARSAFFASPAGTSISRGQIERAFARLPLLATYLGHVNLSGTQAYLPMTPELLDEASKCFARYACADDQENDDA